MKKVIIIFTLLIMMFISGCKKEEIYNDYYSFDITSNSEVSLDRYLYSNDKSIKKIELPSELLINDIKYSVTSISSYAFVESNYLEEIIIPSSITEINEGAFYGCSSLTSIEIKSNLKTIQSNLFYGCSALKIIDLPKTIEEINSNAFQGCSSLTSIEIKENVEYIGGAVFYGCISLKEIIVNSNNNQYKSVDGILYTKDGTELIQFPTGSTKDNISITEYVKKINAYSFALCKLVKINLSSTVEIIGSYAFADSIYLEEINLNNGLLTIQTEAFKNCSSLTSIEIPNSVKEIENGILAECTSLKEINVTNNLYFSSIEGNLYNKQETQLIHYAIGKEDNSFIVSNKIDTIRSEAFYGNESLEQIEILGNVLNISSKTFYNCISLEEIILSSETKDIESFAFYGCISLKSIDLTNITTIQTESFKNCSSLENIFIPASLSTIGTNAFTGCKSLTSFNVDDSNESFTSIEDVLYSKDGKQLINFPSSKNQKTFTIPNSVIAIAANAFYLNSIIEEVTMSSVSSIGYYAFNECTSLKTISLSENIVSIGSGAFKNCVSLTSISIPNNIISINDNTFYGCISLEEITIPSTLRNISYYSFYNCISLKSIIIPSSVEVISFNAFAGCSSLTISTSLIEQPTTWDFYWNPDNCKVLWGVN